MMGCSKDFFFCSICFEIIVFRKKKEVAGDDKMLNVIVIIRGVVN